MKPFTRFDIVNNAELIDYLSSKSVSRAFLFGSIARGEATDDSDIDILLESDDAFSLFELSRMRNELSELLHHSVDLIPSQGIYDNVRAEIEKDRVLIFERNER